MKKILSLILLLVLVMTLSVPFFALAIKRTVVLPFKLINKPVVSSVEQNDESVIDPSGVQCELIGHEIVNTGKRAAFYEYVDSSYCVQVFKTLFKCTRCETQDYYENTTPKDDSEPFGHYIGYYLDAKCDGYTQTHYIKCKKCKAIYIQQFSCPDAPHGITPCTLLPI